MMDGRAEIIRRIGRLRPDQFIWLQRVLDILDCGDLSPLSALGAETESRGSELQRLAAKVAGGTKSGSELPQSKGKSGDESPQSKDWPHAPLHRISESGTYIVTAGTLHKEHWFRGPERLGLLQSRLLEVANQYRWCSAAWLEQTATAAQVKTVYKFKTDRVRVQDDFEPT